MPTTGLLWVFFRTDEASHGNYDGHLKAAGLAGSEDKRSADSRECFHGDEPSLLNVLAHRRRGRGIAAPDFLLIECDAGLE